MISLPVCLIAGCAMDSSEPSADESTELARTPCVVRLPANEETCYANFRDAVAAATGGAILDAPMDSRTAAVDTDFIARVNGMPSRSIVPAHGPAGVVPADVVGSGDFVLGIVYTDVNYGGTSRVYTAPYACCLKWTFEWTGR